MNAVPPSSKKSAPQNPSPGGHEAVAPAPGAGTILSAHPLASDAPAQARRTENPSRELLMLPQMAGRPEIRVTGPLYPGRMLKARRRLSNNPKANPKNVPLTHPCTHVLFDLDGVLLDTGAPLHGGRPRPSSGASAKTFTWKIKREEPWVLATRTSRMPHRPREAPRRAAMHVERVSRRTRPHSREARDPVPRDGGRRGVRAEPRGPRSPRRRPRQEAAIWPLYTANSKVRPHPWFDLFGAVVCGDDPRVIAKKPAPDIFLVAARDLRGRAGALPLDVFEDSLAGVRGRARRGHARRGASRSRHAGPDHGQHYRAAHHVLRGWSEASLSLLVG